MARRWLLLLGSNLASAACLREALDRLAALGEVDVLTAIRQLPANNGRGRDYHNVLVVLGLESDIDAAKLAPQLKRIESGLGRRPGEEVAIDIDILAAAEGARWRVDAHALAKREFEHAPATTLLAEAGISLEPAI